MHLSVVNISKSKEIIIQSQYTVGKSEGKKDCDGVRGLGVTYEVQAIFYFLTWGRWLPRFLLNMYVLYFSVAMLYFTHAHTKL